MTGESDYRTPISQAEEYYEALKLQGIESLLMRVPEEPHGIAVRPSHHIAKLLSVLAWFDKHRSDSKPENTTLKASEVGIE
jgi:acylaminoacyl-peptidase